ncbi:hypothetical protein M406DRAFT_354894 [Cryphonectria parasitica EP155]|uniref:Uncharacterized protein n=1 Tax=Cryphonectria parasitica (strain ATCC 38755 / EP155) TaxID=660469 RepID=A0A9P5CSK3_CRYP1|nr:uncharacterized protein M406DRAFT_354894 [Cryphonectria parasitica EP155]KAF3768426.1 hypothetical protein M406DRAFT_354894 [Cryphonectria parasitica EP155]
MGGCAWTELSAEGGSGLPMAPGSLVSNRGVVRSRWSTKTYSGAHHCLRDAAHLGQRPCHRRQRHVHRKKGRYGPSPPS